MGRVLNLKSEIQLMRYFHYYYETGIKRKSGIGLAEVWDMNQFKESEIIKDVEKQKKEKVTKFELNEINQSEFKSLSLLMEHRTPNDLTSSLSKYLKFAKI